MRDLNRHIVQQQAAQWEMLGLELGLKRYHIDNISRDHPNRSVICCGEMLRKWLDIDPSASWRKLDDAVRRIRSPTTDSATTVSSDSTGNVFLHSPYVLYMQGSRKRGQGGGKLPQSFKLGCLFSTNFLISTLT